MAARSRHWRFWGAVLAVAVAFLVVPPLAGIPGRLIEGCAKWIAVAATFELLSVLGFIVLFKLVFGAGMSWRQSSPAGLRALGASAVLPAGGLIGPVAGAWPARGGKASLWQLTRSSIGFVIVTNAPGVIVLAALGTTLWLGWPAGPHEAVLTLLPAALALLIIVAAWRTPPRPVPGAPGSGGTGRHYALLRHLAAPAGLLRDGVADARALVAAGNWKLVGAFGYYAFDNALLWAAFRAYGRTPPLGVIVMGYLIGSLAGALPTPAGLGAVEGGLIGALVLYGAPAAPTAAAVLLYRGLSLVFPLVLGALAWRHRPRARLPRASSPEPRPRVGHAVAPGMAARSRTRRNPWVRPTDGRTGSLPAALEVARDGLFEVPGGPSGRPQQRAYRASSAVSSGRASSAGSATSPLSRPPAELGDKGGLARTGHSRHQNPHGSSC